MISNSKIFSTTLFGSSSGLTPDELTAKNTSTIETYLQQQGTNKLSNRIPKIPSNQGKAKDK
jgi:hypothetical protein